MGARGGESLRESLGRNKRKSYFYWKSFRRNRREFVVKFLACLGFVRCTKRRFAQLGLLVIKPSESYCNFIKQQIVF